MSCGYEDFLDGDYKDIITEPPEVCIPEPGPYLNMINLQVTTGSTKDPNKKKYCLLSWDTPAINSNYNLIQYNIYFYKTHSPNKIHKIVIDENLGVDFNSIVIAKTDINYEDINNIVNKDKYISFDDIEYNVDYQFYMNYIVEDISNTKQYYSKNSNKSSIQFIDSSDASKEAEEKEQKEEDITVINKILTGFDLGYSVVSDHKDTPISTETIFSSQARQLETRNFPEQIYLDLEK